MTVSIINMPLSYFEWNERLFNHYFGKDKQGTEVLLYANKQVIENIGGSGSTIDDFINAVKKWPGYKRSINFCQRAHHTFLEWKDHPGKFPCPPYIAYLVFFVYVSTTDDPTQSDSYHRRLNTILGQQDRGISPQPAFYDMWELWQDLEDWTDFNGGKIGHYTRWTHGYHGHIGIPLSQSLISNEEISRLPCIFYKARLTPDLLVSEETLRQLLVINGESGRNKLSSSLINFLKENRPGGNPPEEKKEAFRMFLKFIYHQLANWDGTNCERDDPTINKSVNVHANICLTISKMGFTAGIRIRYPNRGSFLDSGTGKIGAEFGNRRVLLACNESPGQNQWSKRLELIDSGGYKHWDIRDNEDIWENGVRFFNSINNVIAALPKCENGIRVFVHGDDSGISAEDWVESYRIERNCEFLIASKNHNVDVLMKWGKSECDEFNKIEISSFVKGWTFYRGKNARESLSGFNNLDLPHIVSLRLEGGLRVKGGVSNQYLQTNLPTIVLFGGVGDEIAILKIYDELRSLSSCSKDRFRWEIPPSIPCGVSLKIEVGKYDEKKNWKKSAQIKLYLTPAKIQIEKDLPRIGKYGEIYKIKEDPKPESYLIGPKIYTNI